MSDDGGIVWEGPQAARTNFSPYEKLLDEIKERPDEWARIALLETSGPANNLRRGLLDRVGSDARWEMVTGKVDDADGNRRYGVFVRYRG